MEKVIYNIINFFLMNDPVEELIKFSKKKKKIIFDIGCYRGEFTKSFIKKDQFKNDYFLFDPNPEVKNFIKKEFNQNINLALLAVDSTNKKRKKFTLNRYFPASGSSLNSSHKKDRKYNFSRRIFFKIFSPFSKLKNYEDINVQTITLDKFCKLNKINFIDILKIDTEGNDLQVLLGAKNMLKNNKIGLIYSEVSGFKNIYNSKLNKMIKYLSEFNFKLYKSKEIKSFSFLSNLRSSDNLFIKQ